MNQVVLWMTWTAVSHKTSQSTFLEVLRCSHFPLSFFLLHVALCLGLVHSWTLRPGMPNVFWPCLYYLYSRPDCAPWRACTSMIAYITYAVSWWRFHPYVFRVLTKPFFFTKSAFTLCNCAIIKVKINK